MTEVQMFVQCTANEGTLEGFLKHIEEENKLVATLDGVQVFDAFHNPETNVVVWNKTFANAGAFLNYLGNPEVGKAVEFYMSNSKVDHMAILGDYNDAIVEALGPMGAAFAGNQASAGNITV